MTSNATTSTEEEKPLLTPSVGEAKSNEDTKKVEEASSPTPVPSVGETEVKGATGESSVAEKPKPTVVVKETETKRQVSEETTDKPDVSSLDALSSLKANKKTKKEVNAADKITTPNAHDVLLGRGKPFQNHDGNQSMLRIVDMYRKRYHESERAFKHEIIEEVLDIIKSKGGRFLERIDDFEKSFWNQVPHRMAYRKVGHAFRSNARRISMEKRDQAHNQRRNASAMARASMMSQFISGNEGMMQRMPMQGVSLPDMMPVGGALGLADAMGIGGSVYADTAGGITSAMYRQGGGTGLNPTQRELLAQEQMLHSSRIERILGNSSNGLNHAGAAASSNRLDSVQSMLAGGGADSLPFTMGGANLAGRSLQLNNMRRMMLLGSGGVNVANHSGAYPFANAGAATAGSRIPNMGLSNIGNLGDASFK